MLRFCPFCGNKLPQSDTIKFCSSCGKSLDTFLTNTTDKVAQTVESITISDGQAMSNNDLISQYDHLLEQSKKQGLPEKEIKQQATELVAKIKAQKSNLDETNVKKDSDSDEYSVVLKQCVNQERLIGKLSGVLRRSMAAMRMAVNMVPCIIIYKSKQADIQAVIDIFKEENLHYTIIKGDFDTNLPPEQFLPDFADLSDDTRSLIQKTPSALWLGEKFDLFIPEVIMAGEKGVLLLTNQCLYFGKMTDQHRLSWLIVPYRKLADVIHEVQEEALELINKQYIREAIIGIANEELLDAAYEKIRKAINNLDQKE